MNKGKNSIQCLFQNVLNFFVENLFRLIWDNFMFHMTLLNQHATNVTNLRHSLKHLNILLDCYIYIISNLSFVISQVFFEKQTKVFQSFRLFLVQMEYCHHISNFLGTFSLVLLHSSLVLYLWTPPDANSLQQPLVF